MARIPDFESSARINVSGVPNLPGSPRIPSLGGASAQGSEYAGRALAGVGGAVQSFGADVSAYYERKQAEADDAWLSKARAQTLLDAPAMEQSLQADVGTPAMSTGGAGAIPASQPKPLAERTKAALEAYQKKVLASAPTPRAKQAYEEWFAGHSAQAQVRAFAADQQRIESQRNADFITALDTHTRLVGTDPTQFDAAWGQVERDLKAAAAWADPSKLAVKRAETRANMELVRARALATNAPLVFLQETTPTPGNEGPENPQKASGGWTDSKYYSHLQPDQIAALTKDAQSAVVRQHNAAITVQKAQHDAQLNDLMVTLLPGGQGGLTDVWEARRQGWLTDYDEIHKAIEAINARDKDAMDLAKAQALFTTGHRFNSFTTDDKKAVDLVYKSMNDPALILSGDQATIARTRDIIQSTGIVPEAAVDMLRGGMVSRDKAMMQNAYTVISALYKESPAAVRRSFGRDDLRKLDIYQRLAPRVLPEELLARIDPGSDPAQTANRRSIAREVGPLVAKIPVQRVLERFDGDYAAAMDGRQQAALMADFREAYATAFSYTQDENEAFEIAVGSPTKPGWIMREKWGVTDIGPTRRLVAYPPEREYDTIEGSHDWIDEQLELLVKEDFPDAVDYGILPIPGVTESNLGASPPYYVWAIKKNGDIKFISSPEWQGRPAPVQFDPVAAVNAMQARYNAARGSLIAVPPPPMGRRRFEQLQEDIRRRTGG